MKRQELNFLITKVPQICGLVLLTFKVSFKNLFIGLVVWLWTSELRVQSLSIPTWKRLLMYSIVTTCQKLHGFMPILNPSLIDVTY